MRSSWMPRRSHHTDSVLGHSARVAGDGGPYRSAWRAQSEFLEGTLEDGERGRRLRRRERITRDQIPGGESVTVSGSTARSASMNSPL